MELINGPHLDSSNHPLRDGHLGGMEPRPRRVRRIFMEPQIGGARTAPKPTLEDYDNGNLPERLSDTAGE